MLPELARVRWALRGLPDLSLSTALYQISTHTMTRPTRAKALWQLCAKVVRGGIPGDLVECGVWMGGSAGLMALALRKFEPKGIRKLHLFDSFEGLPSPSKKDGQKAEEYWKSTEGSDHPNVARCVADAEVVRAFLYQSLRIPPEQVVFHEGWFQNTLPLSEEALRQIAVLRLDGDWYDSTRICLEHLYDRVSPGGVILLDDYFCWEGCRKATDEFRAERGLHNPIIHIDEDSGYWIKESPQQ